MLPNCYFNTNIAAKILNFSIIITIKLVIIIIIINCCHLFKVLQVLKVNLFISFQSNFIIIIIIISTIIMKVLIK